MEEKTMAKFGKFLKDLSSNESVSSALTEAYGELDELKQKRITKITEMAN